MARQALRGAWHMRQLSNGSKKEGGKKEEKEESSSV